MRDAAAPSITVLAHSVRESGGMERTQHHIVVGLLERGWRVRVLAWRCDVEPHPNLEYVRLPVPRRPFLVEQSAYAAAAGAVLAARPERGVVSSLGAVVLCPVDVVTLQYVHHTSRSGRVSTVAGNGVRGRANARYVAASRGLALRFERHCYRPDRLDRVIAVSAALRNELVAAFPALHDRVRVIPNGTDTARFRPNTGDRAAVREQLGLLPNGLVAIFAGGDWPRKGLHIAIEAIVEASGWELLVIGRGDVEKHRRQAVDAGVAGRVHFAGAVGDPERYFAAADVFVLPTAYEGFPLVSIEAAATGLPLLMTREANAEAVLTDGVSGCVLPREAATFARSLCELGADPARRARLGSAARTAALALDWRGIVDQHEAVYREMLHRARKA